MQRLRGSKRLKALGELSVCLLEQDQRLVRLVLHYDLQGRLRGRADVDAGRVRCGTYVVYGERVFGEGYL